MQTIEINGRAIAVMGGSHDEVDDFARGPVFESDMLTFTDQNGRALWDGRGKFDPYIRECFPDEVAAFERGFAKARAEGETEDRESWLVFLVKLVDPTDDADGDSV